MSGSSPTLLAFDFDGTLAPIREDPGEVQIERGAAALLAEAANTEGVVVAVVSGRDADDLTMRLDMPGAYIIGSHGLEIRAPGGAVVRDAPALAVEPTEDLVEQIARAGMRIERKKHAIAIHWRGAVSELHSGFRKEAVTAAAESFREWARSQGLDVIEGRYVVEARCPGGGKEAALRWLTTAVGASRVVYAGDDVTDFGPLRFASERGLALFIASSERTPPPGVTVVSSLRELFRLVREEVMM